MSGESTAAAVGAAEDHRYDVEKIRADFPILSRDVYGKPLVYLDNGASAQKPRQVIEVMDHTYRFEYANVHRGLHYLSNTATAKFEEARETVRKFLNAPSSDEIIFTRNATGAINLVAQSFGGMVVGEGDEIVLSIMEHHSNIVPWNYHRERRGAVLKWAPIADDGSFLIDEFEALLGPKTKMVAITHMSNVLGTIVPIKQVIEIAHARGIPVLVDGSQAAVHMPVDVQDLDCDFYAFTGHKTYGPTGIGVLYAKAEHLDRMPPYEGGGEMIEIVTRDKVTYAQSPHKFEAGTPMIVEAIGLGTALNYMMDVGRDRIAAHEAELAAYAKERLAPFNWLTIHGTAPGKGAIVSFSVEGLHPHDVSTVIDRSGIAVRAGHHCAQPLMERIGVTATCRASFAMYNTKAEIDALAEALERARALFA
ncbi:selenocysteine lyase, PLP-dependent [Candidatus Filomicrobium marinum]|uniref:Cysteine desulfurase n=2 Tax=Filomicrobium TaxID=119044 RepID=A0A0D6JA68_9HYPH|nr:MULTISPECIES: cysteine desulfurase [Filomicrobium]MCV0368622.1 cysteine desulfurase [Filomicrobium sp.]CFX00850.1 selenocysteine lyase, PLP-dependent [Candidatus Filomicrobium marinum]CPR15335.1 selenocysteine lyase, PLP-dependent [Candidatus Filomicrobium marinum]SDO66860.1 cysteine desulfurase [Filomicrobium insigne]